MTKEFDLQELMQKLNTLQEKQRETERGLQKTERDLQEEREARIRIERQLQEKQQKTERDLQEEREARVGIERQLGETQQQLGETQQQLGETQQQLGETQQQLGETQQQLKLNTDALLEKEYRELVLKINNMSTSSKDVTRMLSQIDKFDSSFKSNSKYKEDLLTKSLESYLKLIEERPALIGSNTSKLNHFAVLLDFFAPGKKIDQLDIRKDLIMKTKNTDKFDELLSSAISNAKAIKQALLEGDSPPDSDKTNEQSSGSSSLDSDEANKVVKAVSKSHIGRDIQDLQREQTKLKFSQQFPGYLEDDFKKEYFIRNGRINPSDSQKDPENLTKFRNLLTSNIESYLRFFQQTKTGQVSTKSTKSMVDDLAGKGAGTGGTVAGGKVGTFLAGPVGTVAGSLVGGAIAQRAGAQVMDFSTKDFDQNKVDSLQRNIDNIANISEDVDRIRFLSNNIATQYVIIDSNHISDIAVDNEIYKKIVEDAKGKVEFAENWFSKLVGVAPEDKGIISLPELTKADIDQIIATEAKEIAKKIVSSMSENPSQDTNINQFANESVQKYLSTPQNEKKLKYETLKQKLAEELTEEQKLTLLSNEQRQVSATNLGLAVSSSSQIVTSQQAGLEQAQHLRPKPTPKQSQGSILHDPKDKGHTLPSK